MHRTSQRILPKGGCCRCPICKSGETHYRHDLFDSEELAWNRNVEIYSCGGCGNFFSIVSGEKVTYDDEYYVFSNHRISADKAFAAHCWDWLAKRTCVSNKRLLDIGCGRGFFCHLAREAGLRVKGLEPAPRAAEEARRNDIPAVSGIFELCDLAKSEFDIVTMWDVLEHFKDPGRCLMKANEILGENGVLAVSVPNHSSIFAAVAGPFWKGYNLYHVSHFNRSGIVWLLRRHGFGVVDLDYHDNNLFSREGRFRLGLRDRVKATLLRFPGGRRALLRRRKGIETEEIITGHNDYLSKGGNLFVKSFERIIKYCGLGDQIRLLAKKE